MNLLSCAELLEFKVLTHRYQQHQQDLLPFSHPLAWEEMRLIKSPPTPFSLLFCTFFWGAFFGVCAPGSCCGQELGSSDFLPWGHWAPAGPGSCIKPVLGGTPMQEASTEKGSSKYSERQSNLPKQEAGAEFRAEFLCVPAQSLNLQ